MARPHKAVIPAATELAALLLCQRMPKYVIKKALDQQMKKTYPEGIPPRSFERIMAHARELNVSASTKTRKELRIASMLLYEGVIADPRTPVSERIKAQSALDKLYGLPITRVIHSGTGEGGAIKTESKTTLDVRSLGDDDLRKLREIRAKVAATEPSTN